MENADAAILMLKANEIGTPGIGPAASLAGLVLVQKAQIWRPLSPPVATLTRLAISMDKDLNEEHCGISKIVVAPIGR